MIFSKRSKSKKFHMGLDIQDNLGEAHMRVGSYSYVHRVRKNLILYTIKYLQNVPEVITIPDTENKVESNDDEEEEDDVKGTAFENPFTTDDAINILQTWIRQQEPATKRRRTMDELLTMSTPIAYENISQTLPKILCHYGISGLYWFVNSSDCEGTWSLGQCTDIAQLLRKVLPFTGETTVTKPEESTEPETTEEQDYLQSLLDVFDTAIKNNGYVILC
jgi:hypothetical protein